MMCFQTLDAVSTCRCFIPLLHRESHLLSDYCLFCIVLYRAKCPEPLNTTLDTIDGHREALGLGRMEPHTHMHWSHIHTFNTNTHMLCKHSYTCSYTLENATYYAHTHTHGYKHTLTAAQRHKAGITMAGREG